MAPGYRNQNRRQNRSGHADHDQFEGLPVRHWRRDYVTVAPPPSQDTNTALNDRWAIELPHGMPKDYHLLPQHSQDLLRGARSGRIYKRPTPTEDDEIDLEGIPPEKVEKKEDETKERGFSAKAWKQVPRHLEGPDLEYLARRKKNVITIGSKAQKIIPTVTKATMKRIDAAGNEYTQDVIVPLGQHIEGEIISQTEIPDPSVMMVDGFPVQQSPVKRKPIPKKKHKAGPGRGRKKKLLPPTSAPVDVDGASEVKPTGAKPDDEIKKEDDGSAPPPSQNEDTEMRDSANASENDDTDEGDDDGDDDADSITSGSPSKRVKLDSDVPPLPTELTIPEIPPPTPILALDHLTRPGLHLDDRTKSDSPLKQVSIVSPAPSPPANSSPVPISPSKEVRDEPSTQDDALSTNSVSEPLPLQEAATVDEAQTTPTTVAESEKTPVNSAAQSIHQIDVEMQEEVPQVVPESIPEPPPAPTDETVQSMVELRKEEDEEEAMLLALDDKAQELLEQRQAPAPEDLPAAVTEESKNPPVEAPPVEAPPVEAPPVEAPPVEASLVVASPAKEQPPMVADTVEDAGEESDTDLLGDLEKSLGN